MRLHEDAQTYWMKSHDDRRPNKGMIHKLTI